MDDNLCEKLPSQVSERINAALINKPDKIIVNSVTQFIIAGDMFRSYCLCSTAGEPYF